MAAKRILIVSQYHPPEMGAAATRWSDYAHLISQEGYDVTVLCEMPNYPNGIIPPEYRGKRYVSERDASNSYQIERVQVWANDRTNTVKRLGFYISFLMSSLRRLKTLGPFDVVIASSPPLFVGWIGRRAKQRFKCPLILDVRDLWPESAEQLGELNSRSARKMGYWLQRKVYAAADYFSVAVPGFENHFKQKNISKPVIPLPNGISEEFVAWSQDLDINPSKVFTVLYSGNFGLAQNLESVLEAADLLRDLPIRFRLIGDGAKRQELLNIVAEKELDHVRIMDPVNRKTLVEEIQSASLCLVPLQKSPLFKHAIPSKLFEYLVSGRPVIATVQGEIETIVGESGSGMCIEGDNPKLLADAIRHYFEHPDLVGKQGAKGRSFVIENFRKKVLVKRLIDFIESS